MHLLQQALGNQGVLGRLQAKLAINQPGDVYEQEADRVAEAVMSEPNVGPAASVPGSRATVQRKCTKCDEEETQVHRKESSLLEPEVPASSIVREALTLPGQPLDQSTRSFMESRLGHDFSDVRVHAGKRAAESASALHALAYTVGNDVIFAGGQYKPSSTQGKRLLAHELAHVVQQTGGTRCLQRQAKATPEADWRELARRQVPWQQWTLNQKEKAESDYRAAVKRIFEASERERFESRESDDELFRLLQPYKPDLKAFQEKMTTTYLDVSATFVSPLRFESAEGKRVTLKATVALTAVLSPAAPTGEVLFEIFKDGVGQVDLHRQPLSGACVPPGLGQISCTATATYTTVALTKGKYLIKATYQPLRSGNRSSFSERFLEVK